MKLRTACEWFIFIAILTHLILGYGSNGLAFSIHALFSALFIIWYLSNGKIITPLFLSFLMVVFFSAIGAESIRVGVQSHAQIFQSVMNTAAAVAFGLLVSLRWCEAHRSSIALPIFTITAFVLLGLFSMALDPYIFRKKLYALDLFRRENSILCSQIVVLALTASFLILRNKTLSSASKMALMISTVASTALALQPLLSLSFSMHQTILGETLTEEKKWQWGAIFLDPLLITLAVSFFTLRYRKSSDLDIDATRFWFDRRFKKSAFCTIAILILYSIGTLVLATHKITSGVVIRDLLSKAPEPPEHFIRIVIAQEDPHYFQHFGVDFQQVDRSLMTNWREKRFARGASTISMQLAKLLYLSSEKTLTRKLIQVWIALYIEQRLTKMEILKLYSSVLDFGAPEKGLLAASHHYFGRSPEALTHDEFVKLSRTIINPKLYDPTQALSPSLAWNAIAYERRLKPWIDHGLESERKKNLSEH